MNNEDDYGIVNALTPKQQLDAQIHHELGKVKRPEHRSKARRAGLPTRYACMPAYKHLRQEPDPLHFLLLTTSSTSRLSLLLINYHQSLHKRKQSMVPQLVPVLNSFLSETLRMPSTGLFSDQTKCPANLDDI